MIELNSSHDVDSIFGEFGRFSGLAISYSPEISYKWISYFK